MRTAVAGAGMATAIAEGVKLLHIAEPQGGLRLHQRAQADLHCAVAQRIEQAEGQAFRLGSAGRRSVGIDGKDQRPLLGDGNDGGIQTDLNGRGGVGHAGGGRHPVRSFAML